MREAQRPRGCHPQHREISKRCARLSPDDRADSPYGWRATSDHLQQQKAEPRAAHELTHRLLPPVSTQAPGYLSNSPVRNGVLSL